MLAHWMGGAAWHFVPKPDIVPVPYVPSDLTGGIPFAKHHGGRPFIDDDEVMEFLRVWVAWNDIE